ncbi:MAG: TPR end-of-group domain-containing protein, partial [Thermoanaerobaculia bacterium]
AGNHPLLHRTWTCQVLFDRFLSLFLSTSSFPRLRVVPDAWVEALRKRRNNGYISPVRIAGIHAWAGDADRAFTWLEKAHAERVSSVASFYEDPSWDPVRNDPRFEQFARKIGLPQVGK